MLERLANLMSYRYACLDSGCIIARLHCHCNPFHQMIGIAVDFFSPGDLLQTACGKLFVGAACRVRKTSLDDPLNRWRDLFFSGFLLFCVAVGDLLLWNSQRPILQQFHCMSNGDRKPCSVVALSPHMSHGYFQIVHPSVRCINMTVCHAGFGT